MKGPAEASKERIERLYREHRDAVFRFCLMYMKDTHTAEDLCQETFAQALRKAGSLRDPERGKAWVMTIAVNTCRAHLRRKRLGAFLKSLVPWGFSEAGPEPAATAEKADPQETFSRESEVRRVLDALGELGERERALFALVALGELNSKEAAERVGCSHAAARQTLSRARRKLQKAMADAGEGEPVSAAPNPERWGGNPLEREARSIR